MKRAHPISADADLPIHRKQLQTSVESLVTIALAEEDDEVFGI